MKKVAIILGGYLHRRHTDHLKPLSQWYDLVGVGSRGPILAKTDIGFEVRQLLAISDVVRRIPKIKHRVGWGIDQYLFGFDKALQDMDILYPSSPTCLFSWQAAQLKKKTGAKLVIHEVEDIPFRDGDNWIWKYRQEALRAADAVIVPTERVESMLVLEGVDPGIIRRVPYGVDTEMFSPEHRDPEALRLLGAEPGEKVVLYAGRIVWDKGVLDIAYAAKRILDDPDMRDVPVKFVFLGNGNAEAPLRRRIEAMGIGDRVLLRPFVPYDKVPSIYASVDIYLMPSIPTPGWQQQWAFGINECLASGTAMIGSLSGCTPEAVGDAAVLVNPADHISLYYALKDLLLDDAKRQELGRCARARAVNELEQTLIARRTMEVFESIS